MAIHPAFSAMQRFVVENFPKQNHFLGVHILILRAGLSDWRSYLNDARKSLAEYVSSAIP
jgi:hypothetical protein